jgi:microcystin-dependent protein
MDGVIAYVTPFAGNFAPRGWALCQGQILAISQNPALFALIGTFYGGNGQTTFALPDLRGRAVVGAGSGPGLSAYSIGEPGGTETTTLIGAQLPTHNHQVVVSITPNSATAASTNIPTGAVYAPEANGASAYAGNNNVSMQAYSATLTTGPTGSNTPFASRNPYLTLNYLICTQGVFPARN